MSIHKSGKKSEAKGKTFITLLLMSFFIVFLLSFAVAPSIIINTLSLFNEGTYSNISINASNIIKFAKELPNNRADESLLGGVNMSKNVLLMHFNEKEDKTDPAMVSASTPSPYVVYSTSDYGVGWEGWRAFDHDYGTRWSSADLGSTTALAYLRFDFGLGNEQIVSGLKVKPYWDSPNQGQVKNFNFSGSNDGSTWITIYSNIHANDDTEVTYAFSNDNAYRYYRFNVNSGYGNYRGIWELSFITKMDFSGMGNNVTINGATWNMGGKLGGAYNFDGSNDYITTKDNPILDIRDTLTISAWIYVKSKTNHNPIVVKSVTDYNNGYYFLVRNSGEGGYLLAKAGGSEIDGSVIDINRWYYVAYTFNSTSERLYIDGKLDKEETPSASYITSPAGSDLFIGQSSTVYWAGYANSLIDEVSIWNRTLSADEISRIYNLSNAKYGIYQSPIYDMNGTVYLKNMSWVQGGPYQQELPNNRITETQWISGNVNMSGNFLLMHFNQDSAYGENKSWAYDFSGMNNNGGFNGSYINAQLYPTFNSSGRFGKAIQINGSTYQYVLIQNVSSVCPSKITVEAWVYKYPPKGGASDSGFIISKQAKVVGNTWANSYAMRPSAGAQYWNAEFEAANGSLFTSISSSQTLLYNLWTHVVGTYDGSYLRLYVNGVEAGSTPMIGNLFYNATTAYKNLIIGMSSWIDYPFYGLIDEVAIYNRTLSANEIVEHYKRGANNLSLQVRSCDDSLCSNANWTGPFGVIPELPNNKEDERKTNPKGANMTGNVLLMHLNNDGAYGENSTFFYDFSGNINNATCNSGLGYCPIFNSSGKFNGAYQFDGVNDYISRNKVTSVQDNWAMSAWINPAILLAQNIGSIVDNGGDGGGYAMMYGNTGGAGNNFYILFSLQTWIDTGYSFPSANRWYHVAATRVSGTLRAYVDGIQVYSGNPVTPFTPRDNLTIGCQGDSLGVPFRFFNGTIDEVAIWNRSLSSQEVYDIYNREKNNYFTNYGLGNLSKISNKRYFQYKAIFETGDNGTLVTPEFFNITFNYEHGPPIVTLNNPTDNSLVNSSIVNLNCSAASSTQLTNITFYINSTGTFTANVTFAVTGISNSANLTLVLPDAYYKWNCLAYNEYNLSSFAPANYTFVVDTTIPFINFTTPTTDDGAHVKRNYTYVNTTASDITLSSAFIDFNRSLVGYWSFNDWAVSGTTAYDNSTYGSNGSCLGITCPNWTSAGKLGGAYQFDGSNDKFLVSNSTILKSGSFESAGGFTISTWLKPSGASENYAIIIGKGDWDSREWTIGIHPQNLKFETCESNDIYNRFTDSISVATRCPIGQWCYIAFTMIPNIGSSATFYVNGVNVSNSFSWTAGNGNSGWMSTNYGSTIGSFSFLTWDGNYHGFFNGSIDEIMIFNRVLSATEINASFNAGAYHLERNFTNLVDANYTYQAWAVDRAGNVNKTETRSVIIDLTSPTITNITLKSNDTTEIDDIDAGDKVNVTVNVTDISGISAVKLLYKYYLSSNYANFTMYNDTFGGTIYNATFIPNIIGNWTYRIWANDTLGNEYYTDAVDISANYEYTWTRTPASFGTVSGILSTTRAIGNITINNTGDGALSYLLTHNSPYEVTFSDNLFVLQLKESKIVEITATFGPVTREYDVAITIDAIDTFADPSLTTTNFTLASYSGGPYFDVQIDVYPTMMNHSQNYSLSGYVKNLGNETGTGTSLNWTLPAGFTINSGNTTMIIGNLTAGSTNRTTLNITAPPSLSTGAYTFSLYSACEQCYNNNCSNESYYINDSQSKIITVICSMISDGACGEGCTYETDASNYDSDCTVPVTTTTMISGGGGMGGGGGAAITSEATFELVRGKDEGFNLEIKNPYSDAKLTNLKVSVEGYLAQYITVDYPKEIAPGSSATLSIKIAAPAYFTKGIHNLTFTIDSIKEKGLIKESWSEKRYVTLAIHEVSKTESLALLNESEDIIEGMKTANFGTKIVSKLFQQSQTALDSNDYEEIQRINEMIKQISQSAFDASNLISEIALKIEESSYKGINTPETSRLLELAKVAAEREDYTLAFERAKEAELTYAVETKGEFNIAYFVARNSTEVFIGTLIALCLLFVLYLRARLVLVNIGLKNTYDNEDVLLGLMKETQKETFIENKRSMEEYNESMMQYENRLSNAVQRAIELETIRADLFRFRGERQRLEEERERLFELMKETQAKYLQGGMIESRIYQNKMHSFSSRLSEIEEKLALREAEAAIRKGRMPSILRRITLPKITLWKHEKEKIIEEEKPGIIFAKEKPVEIPKEEKKWVEELIEGKPETLRERIKKIKRYGRLDIPKVDNPFLVPFVKPEDLSKEKTRKKRD